MKTSELRIRNLLEYCGAYVYVLSIHRSDELELGYYPDSIGFIRHITNTDLKEIPLTEEWLVKFGFKRLERQNARAILWTHEKMDSIEETSKGNYFFYKPLVYVHQLQNLYFALTGEELTIKKSVMK